CRRSPERPLQLEDGGHQPVTHLVVDAQDRGVVGIVCRAYSCVSGLDRLSHRFVLEGTGDATSDEPARGAGIRCPWHSANDRAMENGRADDLVARACDPEPVFPNAWVLEPEPPPLRK